jgi:hypothetical protein
MRAKATRETRAAAVHELGHAIFGFKHTAYGIMNKNLNPFENIAVQQQQIIRNSIWGH